MTRTRPLGREFQRFWISAGASNLGDGIRRGAVPLLALSLTDDARLIAAVTAATLLPWLVFGPIGGVIVDRSDRRRLIIVGQLGRAAVIATLTLLIVVDAATIWVVIVSAFLVGVGEVVVDTSAQAAIPQLVDNDQLDRANGRMIAAVTVLDQVAGTALGAVLFAVAAGLPFVVDTATFVVGALLVALVRRPLQGPRQPRSTVTADVVGGMRFLFGHPFLRAMMAGGAVVNVANGASFAVLVVLVVDELDASEATFGLVLSVGAVGGVVGSFVAAKLVALAGRSVMVTAPALILAGAYLINAAAGAPWMPALASFLVNFAIICLNVPSNSLRQAVTPNALLGRVAANFRMVTFGAVPVGAITGGLVAETFNARAANLVGAGLAALAFALYLGALRHLDGAVKAAS